VEKFGALIPWSPRLAARFMESDDGAEAVKNRYLNDVPRGIFAIRLSRDLPIPLMQAGSAALALSQSRRYISPAFPDKTASETR
jgi:hypothetical protein